ncbi:exodeoxyribonuclease V beta subunit [Propionicimonas paludicola]|uniref:RecBCD enzyme subunit RecB n=1 Tax=Propionicimonas paludicola TaxID=185243 RepID=A0A2A9CTL4_9ACTN|nr:UvrD-helicase domain-containing protein [Propionicimonas paludicola]PFG16879.1 exodeoxyribonuclease V beta subunit [Propionicimonas paludicola]
MIPFDPAGRLPTGTTVLEASAGTGKTYAIGALAVRYLAEGVVRADELAVISFSRIASAELRAKVRQRIVRTIACLQGSPDLTPDPADRLLATGTPQVVAERIARLEAAATELDRSAIMTIHQFCQAMLAELGVQAAVDTQARLTEDLSRLLGQVCADLYLARYARHPDGAPFPLAIAQSLAREAVERLTSELRPSGVDGIPGERREFALAVRAEFERRKQAASLFTFDDQLLRLEQALQGPTGQVCAERLRRRCRVVLVDEFQDTDPVQWAILRQTFHGHVPLVLIGDPKQSIYSFRGADVEAYRDAVANAAEHYSLAVNWRSDPGVVSAVSALFAGVSLGAGIEVPPVECAQPASRLIAPDGSPWRAPARLRCHAPNRPASAEEARRLITQDLTAQVVDLLSSGLQVVTPDGPRPLQPKDVAVLVTRNRRGKELADALTAAGVAVSFGGADSIFASHAAGDWLTLLRAIDQPQRANLRAAFLTDFIGADLTDLATADSAQLTAWAGQLQSWSHLLAEAGVAGLFAAVGAAEDPLPVRVLRRPRGERDLTDYRHLAQLLHAKHTEGIRGAALVGWLEEQVTESTTTTDRLRRLETDREAVQILTVHKAKGLQFPVVLLPEAADLWVPDTDDGACLDYHDGEVRVLDVGGATAPGRFERLAQYQAERGEDQLRALYVALTRAQSQVTMWWTRTWRNTAASPLHRLLFRRRELPGTPELGYPLDSAPGDGHPRELAWLSAAGVVVEECPSLIADAHLTPTRTALQHGPLAWQRSIDQSWRRTSYSGLTEAVHARSPFAADAELEHLDEPPADPAADAAAVPAGRPSPMAALPGGTGFGSLVHEIFENLDWFAPTPADRGALAERLLAATDAANARFAVPGVTSPALAEALLPGLLTPLGRLTDDRPLAAISIGDRLSELGFEFPLGRADSTTTLAEVAQVLRRWLPADDPLAGYPDALADPSLSGQLLRGFLTGSIDSVLRIGPADQPRFVVIDYKTNRLGGDDLTLEHYSLEAMTEEMIRTHYPLQAILYCVALHRFLGQRVSGYRPELHLGGVGYLFVRGLAGEGGGPTGNFSWFPPAGLVVELSELLADRGRP